MFSGSCSFENFMRPTSSRSFCVISNLFWRNSREMRFKKIFVTVGTTEFDDLITKVSEQEVFRILKESLGCEQLTLQIGRGKKISFDHFHGIEVETFDLKDSIAADIDDADLVGFALQSQCDQLEKKFLLGDKPRRSWNLHRRPHPRKAFDCGHQRHPHEQSPSWARRAVIQRQLSLSHDRLTASRNSQVLRSVDAEKLRERKRRQVHRVPRRPDGILAVKTRRLKSSAATLPSKLIFYYAIFCFVLQLSNSN